MKSVLSLQSAVTIGAVGNTIATHVLSTMGHILMRIDTIQLIAHPGHGAGHGAGHGRKIGGVLLQKDFSAILNAITEHQFQNQIDAIMTGYIGHASQIPPIAKTLKKIKKQRPEIEILVDPAMGDHGKLYVLPAIADNIQKTLIPLADVITPNAFEFKRITGLKQNTIEHHIKAGQKLLEQRPQLKAIAVTGCSTPDKNITQDLWIGRDGWLSHNAPPLKNNGISGGGDLFAAILMGQRLNHNNWRESFEKTAPLCRKIIHANDHANDRKSTLDIDLEIVSNILKKQYP